MSNRMSPPTIKPVVATAHTRSNNSGPNFAQLGQVVLIIYIVNHCSKLKGSASSVNQENGVKNVAFNFKIIGYEMLLDLLTFVQISR